jgi:diguanylate cyclase (GGDEF)-like protein
MVGDLDRFKALNDRWGHAEGDRALQAVAAALLAATRVTDVVGRLGGDEFVVVLPATDAAGAAESHTRIAEALHERMQDLPEPISVTFGTASFPADGRTPEELLDAADARLLSRKRARAGRSAG